MPSSFPMFLLPFCIYIYLPLVTSGSIGEIWSAFFAFNSTSSSCSSDSPGARFYTARYSPTSSNSAWKHFISESYSFPSLSPIHSTTLSFQGGSTMAADPTGRRAWALIGTKDWTPHTFVIQLSFPIKKFNTTSVVGVCELVNSTMALQTYLINGLTYSSTIIKGGGAYFLNADPSVVYYGANVSVVKVPPLNTHTTNIPPCILINVSTISTSGAFSPFLIPLPIRGTDKLGNPLIAELLRDPTNSSQIFVQTWSALTGVLVYNQTWACGLPSYLYSCPPTNAGLPNGLNAAYLTNGVLFFGGGYYTSQQYYFGEISALATEKKLRKSTNIQIFTNVNASTSQMSYFTSSNLFVTPGKWPIIIQNIMGTQGTCVSPIPFSNQYQMTSISKDGKNVISTPFGTFDGQNAACPMRHDEIPTWFTSATCSGSSYASPDLLF
jgi:hypothetical protein